MSSTKLPQRMDSNLEDEKSTRKNIVRSIVAVRSEKEEVAKVLRVLGAGKAQENENVKEAMKKLLAAYDDFGAAETQYMDDLKAMLTLREQATLELAKKFEKNSVEEAKILREG